MIPSWASELISRKVDTFLAAEHNPYDTLLVQVVQQHRAWMVYGDMGGVLLLSEAGEILSLLHDGNESHVETDSPWWLVAWFRAAELAPELGALLPDPPKGRPYCPACAGTGRMFVTPTSQAMPCGSCWDLHFGKATPTAG